jgi:membrane-associated protein
MALEYEQVKGWVESYGPAAVGLGSTLDNTGVPVFFVAGMAAAVSLKVPIEAMWAAAFLGSVVGDLATYAIGRYVLTKDKLVAGFLGQNLRMGPTLHAGERVMGRWGPLAIVFGRFVPYVGKVLPFLAGSYRVGWVAATISVVIGSALLTSLYYAMGAIATGIVARHHVIIRYASMGVLAVVVAGLYYANLVLKRKNERAAPSPPPTAGEEEAIEL